ncbi:hypothetical protein HDU76_007527 [Blyttiomyces sp. JEL0837]|nr:hypothetical protein HDU76_007527 [Blyttiomyces sp. JEL0837]
MSSSQQLAPVPWNSSLQNSFRKNFDDKSVKGTDQASMRANGTPKIQLVVFQDFLKSDPRVLIFSGSTRNSELMSAVKVTQTHEIIWFGSVPRNISIPEDNTPSTISTSSLSQDDFWESARLTMWRRLSPQFRASWTWPSSGEHRGPGPSSAEWSAYKDIGSIKAPPPTVNTGYKILKLDSIEEELAGNNSGNNSSSGSNSRLFGGGKSVDEETRCAHNAALDSFCILVFKATRVDHLEPGSGSSAPTRTVYNAAKDGSWQAEEINP